MVMDGQFLAVFNSAHRVMKAEGILKGLGLEILLIPAPRQLQTDCGLALRFSEDRYDAVMGALEEHRLLPAFVSRREHDTYTIVWGETA